MKYPMRLLVLLWIGCCMPVRAELLEIELPAPSLHDSRISTGRTQRLSVYLPPAYETQPTRRFPVVYYLAGYGMSASLERMLPAFESEAFQRQPFVVVGIAGENAMGGGFFVNSPAGGRWEDYILNDVIPFVQAHFRVMAQRAGRGLAGHSMGGHGALYIGMRHPDLFSAVYAQSPGLFDKDGLREALPLWPSSILQAYGVVFAPSSLSPLATQAPRFDGSEEDRRLIARWESGFGAIEERIAAYLAGRARLDAIRIEYMRGDRYTWIPKGSRYTIERMHAAGVACESQEYAGGHGLNVEAIQAGMLPFFGKAFVR